MTVVVALAFALGFTTKTDATVYVNKFEEGKIETNFDVSGSRTFSQFNNNYFFDDDDWPGSYSYIFRRDHVSSDDTSLLNVGTSSGFGFMTDNVAWSGVSNVTYTRDEVTSSDPLLNGNSIYKVKGKVTYPSMAGATPGGPYTLEYELTTTTDKKGEIRHDVTIKNISTDSGGAHKNLPNTNLVMFLDTSLNDRDGVPLYARGIVSGDPRTGAFMYLPDAVGSSKPMVSNGKMLRFDLLVNNGIKDMYVNEHAGFQNSKTKNVKSGKKGQMILSGVDTSVAYEIEDTANLEYDEVRSFSYSEKLTLFGDGSKGYVDESGNTIYTSPDNEVEEYEKDQPLQPIEIPAIPGYIYSHAETWVVDDHGNETKPVNVFYEDPTKTEEDSPKTWTTKLIPIAGRAPGVNFKIKLVYRPVDNMDTIAGSTTNTDTDTTPGNNNKPGTDTNTNTNNNTNTETDHNTGNTVQVPTTAAKKGEAVYAVNKLGLYKGVNFNKSSRIKAYAKKTRVNRPQFIVKGYAYSKSGALRYLVQQYNPRTNKYVAGTKGYITASRKYVQPVYYKATGTKRIKVINTNGVKAYSNKQLTNFKKTYKKGTTLKVKKVVKRKYATRFQLTNGLYVTGSKKFVMFK